MTLVALNNVESMDVFFFSIHFSSIGFIDYHCINLAIFFQGNLDNFLAGTSSDYDSDESGTSFGQRQCLLDVALKARKSMSLN